MSHRAWPAALLTGAALTAACVVVADHVAATTNGCLDSAGWFTATPATWTDAVRLAEAAAKYVPEKAYIDPPAPASTVSRSAESPPANRPQISGCLDVDRIVIPAPPPADGRA